MFNGAICGKGHHQHGRNNGKIFRHIVGDAEGSQRPAGHQELLADFHDFDQLGGIRIQVYHIARLFGRLGAGIHGHPHIGLGQGRSVVGPVPGHGYEMSRCLLAANQGQFIFRFGLGQKIIHAGFFGNGGRGQRVVPGDHHGFDPHGPEALKAVRQTAFDNVLEVNGAQDLLLACHHQRRTALKSRYVEFLPPPLWAVPVAHKLTDGVRRPFAILLPVQIDDRSCESWP